MHIHTAACIRWRSRHAHLRCGFAFVLALVLASDCVGHCDLLSPLLARLANREAAGGDDREQGRENDRLGSDPEKIGAIDGSPIHLVWIMGSSSRVSADD